MMVRCPQCEGVNLQLWQKAMLIRDVYGIGTEGKLLIEKAPKIPQEHIEDQCLVCVPCGHEFPIPKDVDLDES